MANNTNSSSEDHNPDWQKLLESALRETDPQKLKKLVEDLEGAMYLRQHALAHSTDGKAEKDAIAKAWGTLRSIQVEKLKYPDWKSE